MNEAKGYVVRGKDERGNEVMSNTLGAVGDAVDAQSFLVRAQCTDVRIFAVAEDGTETPLPTYEEALASAARADAISKAWARLVETTENLFLLGIAEAARAAADPKSGGRDLAPERATRETAKQALRDLGVDVDVLLKEAGR